MLDERIKKRLADGYGQLQQEGKLLSRAKLEECYQTFRSRFGPEALANLGGQALLELMHAHGSKDSLVYWLEFKNDEEFPYTFGSIAGGSALKFGIFRRKETGAWMGADESNSPKEITIEEAISTAQRHRDELLKGVELLSKLPPDGTDQDYRGLQGEMDRVAPSVSNMAWGHKYFHLIFPEKLDDFHIPDLQRFHLLKMLQMPPEGGGRYICAGRFVAIAAEIDVPMNHLTTALSFVNGRKHRYWRIGTSDGTAPRNRWDLMRDGNCVAVGWPDVGDLNSLIAEKESREKLRNLIAEHYPNVPTQIGNATSQLLSFVNGIQKNDLVLASDGASVIAIGETEGDYRYEPSSDFPHRRDVRWLSMDEWRMPNPEGLQSTVREIKKYPKNILEVTRHLLEPAPAPGPTPIIEPPITIKPHRLTGIPERIHSALERKGQVILYGPPGTGKTYWAELAASEIVASTEYGKPYSALDSQAKERIHGTGKNDGQVRLCCFHPAYGYEDFIEGYRPQSNNGQLSFVREDGILKQLCKDAEKAKEKHFILLIDEINRGDIPRIFGELLTIIEKDKREKSIILPISRESFSVSQNVFLIGTMNTADRSISLLDAALRRRFAFIELLPDSSLFGDHIVAGIPLKPWFEALNKRICEHVGRDARNLQVGHSYFLNAGLPVKDIASFRKAFQDDVIPLLEEYCYDNPAALENILGKGLFDSQLQLIRHELFSPENEEKLTRALMETCPEILESPAALKSAGKEEENGSEENEVEEAEAK